MVSSLILDHQEILWRLLILNREFQPMTEKNAPDTGNEQFEISTHFIKTNHMPQALYIFGTETDVKKGATV